MARGLKDIAKYGVETQFRGENAVIAGAKGNAAKRMKKCLKDIAHVALYARPPLSKDQLKPVAEYYGVSITDLTIADVALFKQVAEALKGERAAFELVAAYAGEKPTDHVEISMGDFSALDEAFEALKNDDTAG